MKRKQNSEVPLVAFAIDAIRKTDDGVERFTLPEAGRRTVQAATRALLLSPAPIAEKRAVLKEVLSIAYALEVKYGCPDVARTLTDTVTAFPQVAEILGTETRALRGRGRRAARFLDAEVIRRAPVIDTGAPNGSMRLSSILASRTRQFR